MSFLRPSVFAKHLLLVVFLFIQVLNVYAQQGSVQGTVTDASTREKLPFTTVAVKGKNEGSVSDENGRYNLSLDAGTHTLIFSFLGYLPLEKKVTIIAGKEIILPIALSRNDSIATWKPVVVTAGRLEQRLEQTVTSMEILPAHLIENRVENTMENAIEQVPGVTVIDGQANIRGGSGFSYGAGSRVLVLVDDLPMLAGDANDVKWNFIPIEQMEQVEVLKGASSALFGSSALNGVINMRTIMPGDKPVTQLTTFAGIYDTPKDERMKWWGNKSQLTTGVNFSHRRKFGRLSMVIGGHFFDDKGYRDGETERRYRGNTHLRYNFEKVKGLTAGIAVNVQQTKGGNFLIWQNDTSGALLPLGGAGATGSTLSEYTSIRATIDPYIIYSPGTWIHKFRTRYFYSGNSNNTEQTSYSSFYYADYIAQRNFNNQINISIGATGTFTNVKGDLYDKRNGSTLGFYFQSDGTFGKLTTSLGFRMESGRSSEKPYTKDKSFDGLIHYNLEKFNPEYLFRTGANYEVWKGGFLRASYGQGFRFPSIAEKFIRTRVGDIVIYPNDSLETEKGWSTEIGIKQVLQIGHWRGLADVSYFITAFRDMMEFSFGSWGNPAVDPLFGLGFKSTNIGNARITGYEINIAGEGKIGQVQQNILAGYTFIDPVQTDFNAAQDTLVNSSTKNILKYRFRHMFKLDAETEIRKISFGISARYYSSIENIDKAFLLAIPGVKSYMDRQQSGTWIFDFRAGLQIIQQLRCTFIIKNLLNEEFMTRPADLQPPRTFTLSLSYKID